MRRVSNALLVALFLTAISMPLGLNLAGIDGADAEGENRKLNEAPSYDGTLDSIGRFGNQFGKWFEDHFGLRSELIRWHGIVHYFWMGVSPSRNVLLGRDGWLFYTEDGGLPDYTNDQPFSDEELTDWRTMIAREAAWCRARGITYLFTFTPDKHAIYPEQFPPAVRQVSPVSRMDQVFTAAADTGAMLDLRQRLVAIRGEERLYHVTDTHWNQRGAYHAYRQIIEAIGARLPAVGPPHARDTFDASIRIGNGMDLARMMGLSRMLTEEDLRLQPKEGRKYVVVLPEGGFATGGDPLIITEVPGSTLPRMVMFRDSFTSSLAPYLSEHFSRVVYVWQNAFDAKLVEQEKPDVVLHQMVGRHLYMSSAYPELVPEP
jgi:alginate O-acetyltransferase complex protein AlgJ